MKYYNIEIIHPEKTWIRSTPGATLEGMVSEAAILSYELERAVYWTFGNRTFKIAIQTKQK